MKENKKTNQIGFCHNLTKKTREEKKKRLKQLIGELMAQQDFSLKD